MKIKLTIMAWPKYYVFATFLSSDSARTRHVHFVFHFLYSLFQIGLSGSIHLYTTAG